MCENQVIADLPTSAVPNAHGEVVADADDAGVVEEHRVSDTVCVRVYFLQSCKQSNRKLI